MNPPRTNQEERQGSTRNNETNPSYEATMAMMVKCIERQESNIMQLGETLEEMRQGKERREMKIDPNDKALERFLKFQPPTFGGTGNEEDAERWLEKMIKIYAPLHYSEERKIQFGVYQLEGPAEAWWKITEQKWERMGVPRTWNAFQVEFNAKFIPQVTREKREEEFMYLKQRALTVSQYEATFTRLAKYAPELVNTEEKRRRKFIHGLNVEIQTALITAKMTTYAEAVEFAQRIEDSQARLRDFQNSRRRTSRNMPVIKDKEPQGPSTTPLKVVRKVKRSATVEKGPVEKKGTPLIMCQFCGGPNHTEAKCRKKARTCWRCGSADHQLKNCPQTTAKKAKVLARV